MIIRFFRSSYLPQYVVLALLALALWIPAMLQPASHASAPGELIEPGYNLLQTYVMPGSVFGVLVSFLLTIGSALLFNYVFEKHDLTSRNSLLPAFIFILFTSILPELQWLHHALIPLLLYILLMNNLLGLYNTQEGYSQVFYAGALLAIASFFSFQSIWYILLVFLSLFVFRIYYWREWIIILLGVINVYFLLWVYFFWTDQLNPALKNYQAYFSDWSFFNLQWPFNALQWVLMGGVLLFAVWSLFRVLLHYGDHILVIRKKVTVILWFAFITLLITVIFSKPGDTFHVVLLSAFAALTCMGLSQLKKTFWIDMLLGVFLVLALLSNYSKLLF